MTAQDAIDRGTQAPPLRDFLDGARLCLPVIVSSAPFGILFGALAVDNGFSVFDATLMSATVFAGASQMVGLELFGQKVAPWLIILSIFAVNFRHVLYSASLGRRIGAWPKWQQAVGFFFLTDPQYAESEKRAEAGREVGFIWYLGLALPLYLCWVIEAALGASFGKLIPDPHALGLDFLLPIYFLGMVMDFRHRPLWGPIVLTSGVASMLAFVFVGSPWHVGLGALAGIALAAVVAPVKPQPPEEGGR
jgi:4-azaleucine resistance transporter AzlC